MNILLVEDDELVRDCLAEILHNDGHSVAAAPDAETALALCRAGAPQAVVSDIDLGKGVDGLALAGALRSLWPALPVLFISGRQRLERHQLGPHDWFLPKPFRSADLLLVVRRLLAAPPLPETAGLASLPGQSGQLYRLADG